MFRLVIVPGVTVAKWARTWAERMPGEELQVTPVEPGVPLPADADAGLLRLPVDMDTFHAVPLYTEATVVVVPKEHFLAAADEVTLSDLDGEPLLRPLDDVLAWEPPTADRPPTTDQAIPLVAAEVGLLVVPQSVARLHHRKDLTFRVVTDAPTSSVGLVWRRDAHTDLVEEMIGIVRGRTANSTRGRAAPDTAPRRGATGTTPRRGATSRRRRR